MVDDETNLTIKKKNEQSRVRARRMANTRHFKRTIAKKGGKKKLQSLEAKPSGAKARENSLKIMRNIPITYARMSCLCVHSFCHSSCGGFCCCCTLFPFSILPTTWPICPDCSKSQRNQSYHTQTEMNYVGSIYTFIRISTQCLSRHFSRNQLIDEPPELYGY